MLLPRIQAYLTSVKHSLVCLMEKCSNICVVSQRALTWGHHLVQARVRAAVAGKQVM